MSDTTSISKAGATPAGGAYNARSRSTALASRGEPMVWLTGGALALCAVMVVALLAAVIVGGSKAFWPLPIYAVTALDDDGETGKPFLAMAVREESYDPSPSERLAIDAAHVAGELPKGAIDEDGRPVRRLYRVGNKDFDTPSFVWHSLWRIKATSKPEEATLLEREDWGIWQGVPTALVREVRRPLGAPPA
ncbi:MAG: hypothetical protein Q8L55_06635, partial [Phycisphaerales bacterium]|nr:hypothetical protein [Phycisphaerales bacterium]